MFLYSGSIKKFIWHFVFYSFLPCSEKIRLAVTEMAALFPKVFTFRTIGIFLDGSQIFPRASRAFLFIFEPRPSNRGRPRRLCEILSICWLQARAGFTESARRRQSTVFIRRTSSWSLSRSSSVPMTLPKLPSNSLLWQPKKTTTN